MALVRRAVGGVKSMPTQISAGSPACGVVVARPFLPTTTMRKP
jgi:hypothetical protein